MRSMVIALAAATALGLGGSASALDVPAYKAAVDKALDAEYPALDALYKDIHQHPELGFQETRTAALLAKEMRAIGFEVTEHVGKTGLPYASRVQADYRGKTTFVDHACGHDIHMASWVGTGRALVGMKDRWHGTLVFIAQPAEEIVGGAKAMVADGLFTRFPKPDYGFALHTGPNAFGQVFYRAGVYSSNSDSVEILFKGRGGHGASPQFTIDPVMIAARFVVDVQGVISREKDPQSPGVVSIGAIQGGSAGNIIPDQVLIRGTVRDYDEPTRARLLAGITRVAKAEAALAGAPEPEITLSAERADAVVNDASLAARTAPVFKAAFGEDAIEQPRPNTASEDYSAFVEAGVPSLYFGIGVYDPKQVAAAMAGGAPLAANHSPYYAPAPEPTIRRGVEAMSLAVMNVMQGQDK